MYWDERRRGLGNGLRRVPDITCTSPTGNKKYVIDCRISWNLMSLTGASEFASYTESGQLAREGEASKRASWAGCSTTNSGHQTTWNSSPFQLKLVGYGALQQRGSSLKPRSSIITIIAISIDTCIIGPAKGFFPSRAPSSLCLGSYGTRARADRSRRGHRRHPETLVGACVRRDGRWTSTLAC